VAERLRVTLSRRVKIALHILDDIMAFPRRICLACQQDFTRKWNGERHNETVHNGLARVVSIQEYLYGSTNTRAATSPALPSTLTENDLDDILTDSLRSIEKEFEECERLAKNVYGQNWLEHLGRAIVESMSSSNPKRTMQEYLRSLRRISVNIRMVYAASVALKMSPSLAEESLKTLRKSHLH
jgi:hypothetical protein